MANTLRFKRGLLAGLPSAAVGEPLFTTDTFDLYIGTASGTQKYQKFIASGTTSQLLRGDGSLLTMPIVLTSPSNGQVLKYNGTSWVNDSDAGITGSGTTNYLPKFTGASTLGNSLVFDNGTSVGIGTATPLGIFQVSGAGVSYFTRGTKSILLNPNVVGADIEALIEVTSGMALTFGTGGSERLRITNGGNVGIGTASPLEKLDVRGNIYTNATNTNLYLDNGGVGGANLKIGVTGSTSTYINSLSAHPILFLTNNVERMRLHAGGNLHLGGTSDNGLRFQVTGDGYFSGSVGVGTSPSYKLEVYDSSVDAVALFNSANANGGHIRLAASGTVKSYIGSSAGFITSGSVDDLGLRAVGAIRFATNGAGTDMMLDASGNLGLGVTPTTKLDVQGIIASRASAFTYSTIDGNTDGNLYITANAGAANTTNSNIIFRSSTSGSAVTERMRLDASGNLGLGVTPSAWTLFKTLQVSNSSFASTTDQLEIVQNAYYQSGAFKYIANGFATEYRQYNGGHSWHTSPNNTSGAGAAITFTQAMTLDASGRLGIGSTATAPLSQLSIGDNGYANRAITAVANAAAFAVTFRQDAANGSGLQIFHNTSSWGTGTPLLIGTSTTNLLTLYGTGNLMVGQASDTGYKLDVNGTMRVSGASTFGGNLTIGDTTTGRNVNVYSSSYGNNGLFQAFGTDGLLKLQMGGLGATTAFLYTGAGNQMQLFSGNAVALTLASNQAATFSSSVTAANLYSTGASNFATSGGNVGIGTSSPTAKLVVVEDGSSGAPLMRFIGNAGNGNYMRTTWFTSTLTSLAILNVEGNTALNFGAIANMPLNLYTNNSIVMTLTGGNVGIGMTPSYKLDVTGSARISDAIAIGTTPDTNLPFKILKNINSTVGIRFENTNTGSSAFSGYQFGTDVTTGTAFTNFLYASSGVVESGVYKPNGTALINTGSGGLNFLAVSQPIRFFTSTGNGTLRAAITNDGDFTQYNGTNPSASTTDAFRMYSADITAGNAAPHFRTENGGIIKLYQQTTGVTSATYIGGAGTGLTDSDTFDGYTIAQIVKALRNAGLLA